MGLPQLSSDLSPQRSEQLEPVDLSTCHSCGCKSPPFQRQRYWFYQNEPLDLRVRQCNIGPSFHSSGSDSQKTNASIETGSCQSDISTSNQQSFLSVLEFSENNSGSIACSVIPPNLSVRETEQLSVKTYNKSSNETQSEYLTKTDISVPLVLESNTLEKSSNTLKLKTDHFLINEHKRDSTNVYKIEKSKSAKAKRIYKKKYKKESPLSIMTFNQESTKKECEYENTKNDYLKENAETEDYPSFVKNLKQDEEPCTKKLRFETSVPSSQNLFTKLTVKHLKKTGESFIQDGKCFEVAPKLPRCRECSLVLQDSLIGASQLKSDNRLCRFYDFRKLRYSSKGFLATAGFLDPHLDTTQEDLRLWQPMPDMLRPDLDMQISRFMLTHVGDQFCKLCKQEEEAVSTHMGKDKKAAWKRPVPGYREMCDVCNTTLFNFHWTCRTCGFAVCIDCYKARRGCTDVVTVERPWLICVNKRAHDQEKLMLTQIIAADSLKHLRQKSHEIRKSLGLPIQCCGCQSPDQNTLTAPQSDNLQNKLFPKRINLDQEVFHQNRVGKEEEELREELLYPDSFDDTKCGRRATINRVVSFEDYSSDTEKYLTMFFSSLKKRLTKSLITNSTPSSSPSYGNYTENNITNEDELEEIILTVFDQDANDADTSVQSQYGRCIDRRYSSPQQPRAGPIPTRVMTLTESRLLYPDCPHSWLCEGRLLKLSDPSHASNYTVFQDQWKRGQPVLVSGVLKFLNEDLWQPDSFIRDFGDTKNDLVNCMTGRVIPGQYMRNFWEGFQEVSKMLKDEKGNPMLLKLKDWPPGEDFAEMLPLRFDDLMKALPMGEYTKRTGQLNLPSRLPSCFAKPDLGPKMYIAYGSAIHPTKGTTNLHLDISDAVNVMVYVGIPKDINSEEYVKEAFKAIDEACSEMLMRQRVREPSEAPGALWHIYSEKDTDKIRHFLTKVAKERRIKLGPHQDPIHDQSWYLDAGLRDRLYKEYDVRGYAIVQCLGDAVFIPAGAPHQVRNLLNCIKVAEDFVSPENVSHCLHLTQEFRKLSDLHTNHEDKLQIKNIIYHTVKDSVSVLSL